LELEKLNLTKLWKEGFPSTDAFFYPSYDTLPKEEEYAFGTYSNRELVIKKFPSRQTTAPNPTSLIFEHRPQNKKVYPLGAGV